MPPLFPAKENDGHGEPPIIKSTGSAIFAKSGLVTSPRFGTPAHLDANTSQQNGSISANHFGSQPSGANAKLAASIPENNEPYFIPYIAYFTIILADYWDYLIKLSF